MQLFYTTDIQEDLAYFSEVEARHAVQVLRRQVGDVLHFVDGKGTLYQGKIIETGKKKCVLSILSRQVAYNPRPFHLTIAIAPTKNINRLEWFLEKTTELGIDTIIPIQCQHSERGKLRLDRLEKVILSAMKQSLKAQLPVLEPLVPFGKLIQRSDLPKQKYIAHCAEGERSLLGEKYTAGEDVMVLIGPEGDFSQQEIAVALSNGFLPTTLGNNRLRTETAGIAACGILNYLNSH